MGGRRGQLIPIDVRKESVCLIDEAVLSGARVQAACAIFQIGVKTYERWKKNPEHGDKRKGPLHAPKNKLTQKEKERIINVCTSEEYCDLPPSQIVPLLADRGQYIASESTFYRVLKDHNMQHHRSNSKAPRNNKPAPLIATRPNEVWSWDITYLPASVRGAFYYLYMIMDIFSRKIVGWAVHESENQAYSSSLIEMTCLVEDVSQDSLRLHSDNGGPMKGSTMLAKLQELHIVPSFSRPSVSNDNPYSESLFGTMKYRPTYPEHAFNSIEKAIAWVDDFVTWYNTQHLHSGIHFVTPEDRHNGFDSAILENRKRVYEKAKSKRPERWSKTTRNWNRTDEVYLNPLKEKSKESTLDSVTQ